MPTKLKAAKRRAPTDEDELDVGDCKPLEPHSQKMAAAVAQMPTPAPGKYDHVEAIEKPQKLLASRHTQGAKSSFGSAKIDRYKTGYMEPILRMKVPGPGAYNYEAPASASLRGTVKGAPRGVFSNTDVTCSISKGNTLAPSFSFGANERDMDSFVKSKQYVPKMQLPGRLVKTPGPGAYGYEPCDAAQTRRPGTRSKMDVLSGTGQKLAPSFSFGGSGLDRGNEKTGSIYHDITKTPSGTAMNSYKSLPSLGRMRQSKTKTAPRPKFGTTQRPPIYRGHHQVFGTVTL